MEYPGQIGSYGHRGCTFYKAFLPLLGPSQDYGKLSNSLQMFHYGV